MSSRLEFTVQSAYLAGRSTLGFFQGIYDKDIKSDSTPVTEADRKAERIIRERIEESFPGESILGEEEGASGAGDDRWVIDPIDGTKSFVAGVPLYSTLLSYEVAGETVVAACYNAALDEMFYAEKGHGAFLNGRRIHVRSCESIQAALMVHGSFQSLVKTNRLDGWMALAKQTAITRGWSDAYAHMLVASGRADLMIDPILAHWDVSAPSLIVREAGGSFTDFKGEQKLGEEAISCVPNLLPQILQAFRNP